MLKKVIAIGMSLMLIMAVLAGCGGGSSSNNSSSGTTTTNNSSESSSTTSDTSESDNSASTDTDTASATNASGDLVTLNLMLVGSAPNDEANVLAAVNEKLQSDGLNLAVKTSYTDDYFTRIALAVAGGEVYDVVWAHTSMLGELVNKGVYQPVDDVMEEAAPYILANTPDYVLKAGQVNGKQYAFSRITPMAQYRYCYVIRGDLREQYGVPEVTTIEGMEAYWDAIMANDPEMICLIDDNMEQIYPTYTNYYFPLGDGGIHPVYVDPTDSSYTVKSFFESEGFKAACDRKVEWYDKGYRRDDITIDSAYTGFTFGLSAAMPANAMTATEIVDALVTNVPEAKIETVMLKANPNDQMYIYQGGDNMLAVASTSKNVKESVQFINWIKSSQENMDLWSYGVEGVNYVMNGDAVSYDGIDENKRYSPNVWMWNDTNFARFSSNLTDGNVEQVMNWDKGAVVTPFVGFTVDQTNIGTEVSQLQAVCKEYYDSLKGGIMTYDSVADEISSKLANAGIDKVIAEVQTQLNDFIASN